MRVFSVNLLSLLLVAALVSLPLCARADPVECATGNCLVSTWSGGFDMVIVDVTACVAQTPCAATKGVPIYSVTSALDVCCAWSAFSAYSKVPTPASTLVTAMLFPSAMNATMNETTSALTPVWGYTFPPVRATDVPIGLVFARPATAGVTSATLSAGAGGVQWVQASIALNASASTTFVTFYVSPIRVKATQTLLVLECLNDTSLTYTTTVLIQVAGAGATFNISETRTLSCGVGIAMSPTVASTYTVLVATTDASSFPNGVLHLVTSPIAVDTVFTTSNIVTNLAMPINASILMLCAPQTIALSPTVTLSMKLGPSGTVSTTEYNSIGFSAYDIGTSGSGGLHVNTVQYVGMYAAQPLTTLSFSTRAYFGSNAAIFRPSTMLQQPSVWASQTVTFTGTSLGCTLPVCLSAIATSQIDARTVNMTFSNSAGLQNYGRYCSATVTCGADAVDAMVYVEVADAAALRLGAVQLPEAIAQAPGYAFLRSNLPSNAASSFDFTNWQLTVNQAWSSAAYQYAAYPITWNFPGTIIYDTNAHRYTATETGFVGFKASAVCLTMPQCRAKSSPNRVLNVSGEATPLTVNSFDAWGPFLSNERCAWTVSCADNTQRPILVKADLTGLKTPSGNPTPVVATTEFATNTVMSFYLNGAVGVTGTAIIYTMCTTAPPTPPPTTQSPLHRTKTVTLDPQEQPQVTRSRSMPVYNITSPPTTQGGSGAPPPTITTVSPPTQTGVSGAPPSSAGSTTSAPTTSCAPGGSTAAPGTTSTPPSGVPSTPRPRSKTKTLHSQRPSTPAPTPSRYGRTRTVTRAVAGGGGGGTGGGAAASDSVSLSSDQILYIGIAGGVVIVSALLIVGLRKIWQLWRKRRRSGSNDDVAQPMNDRMNQYRWYEDAAEVARDVESRVPGMDHEGLLVMPRVEFDATALQQAKDPNAIVIDLAPTLPTAPRNPLSRDLSGL